MPSAKDLRIALARAKQRIREAEDELLLQRRRAQELAAVYAEAETVRSEALPASMRKDGWA